MSMTVDNAIEVLRTDNCYECAVGAESAVDCTYEKCRVKAATKLAISALEEVQQLHAIGTVEELREFKKLEDYWLQVGYALKAYESIGTLEEFRELKEKATAKPKPIERGNSTGCVYNNVERDWDFMK